MRAAGCRGRSPATTSTEMIKDLNSKLETIKNPET